MGLRGEAPFDPPYFKRRLILDPQQQPDPKNPSSWEAPGPVLREYDSAELLQGEKEVLIRHGNEVYRLRLTKNDKLILQK